MVSIEKHEGWRSTEGARESMRALKPSEQIANHLRGQIVRGEIVPGEMLPRVKTLTEQFGVSRPTLSGAFRVLESEGLLTVLAGARGGPQARMPDLSIAARNIGLYLQMRGTTVADLLEAQIAFEPQCARFLAERCSPEGLAQLCRSVELQREALDAGIQTEVEFERWAELVAEFHALVAGHCGNNTLAAQSGALHDVIVAHRRLGIRERVRLRLPTQGEAIQSIVDGCHRLTELVRAGDCDNAERHWREHFTRIAASEAHNRDVSASISIFD